MTTGTEVIHDALQEILVQADEQEYQPAEYQSGMRALNDMVSEWDISGLALGFTLLTNIADPVTVPAGLIGAVKSNLAVRLAPQFDKQITPGLFALAKSGMKAVRHFAVVQLPTRMPSTMPIGSGNERESYSNYSTRKFYPEPESGVLTEDNGNILLESETNDE
jgi:hypothetical protein